jgi:hypothetical protein
MDRRSIGYARDMIDGAASLNAVPVDKGYDRPSQDLNINLET